MTTLDVYRCPYCGETGLPKPWWFTHRYEECRGKSGG